jgi:phosphoglycolate phosphatase
MANPRFSSVRGLIFDLDGTLIDSKLDLIHSVNAMLRELGRPELHHDTIAGYIGRGAPLLIAQALGETASESERQRGLQFFLEHYEDHKLDNTCAYPGVSEALEKLATFPMAVLTNKPVRISGRILEGLGLMKYFRVVYGGNSFETKKPDPQGALVILKELALAPHETLLVGDSDVDIETARNAGTLAAAANYGFGVRDPTRHPADVCLERFDELASLFTNPLAF